MSFELSFAPEFFLAEGEPYDRSDLAVNAKNQPVSVWSALHMMSDEEWEAMCKDVFPGVDSQFVTKESVLDVIKETDTCRNLSSPVEVYIDSEGFHSVNVYENDC